MTLAIVEVRFGPGTHEHYLVALAPTTRRSTRSSARRSPARLAALARGRAPRAPRSAARRRAVQQLGRPRRAARAQALSPASRRGRIPSSRCSARSRLRGSRTRRGSRERSTTEGPPLETALVSITSSSRRQAAAGSSRSRRSATIRPGCPSAPGGSARSPPAIHAALASNDDDPHFAPEEPSAEALGCSPPRSTRRSRRRSRRCRSDDALGAVAHRAEDLRDLVQELASVGPSGLAIRTHGDYHLGQVLWTTDGDWVVIDFEGEPAARCPSGAGKRSPLRDLAGMTRSFAYAGDAALLLEGVGGAGGLGRGLPRRPSSTATSRRRTSGSCPRADRASSGCSSSTSSRSSSTSSATRRATGRSGRRSRSSACSACSSRSREPPGVLGELDLHLLGEGRHERLWERLGAHPLDAEDAGVRFAVWAPNARAVSVVGDWNSWSEGVDALEPQESSGVWAGVAAHAREGMPTSSPSTAPTASRVSRPIRSRSAPRSRPPPRRSSTARATRGRTTTG